MQGGAETGMVGCGGKAGADGGEGAGGEEGVGGGDGSSLTLRFPRRVPSRRTAGKHRKHPGGRGNAGGQHHHRIMFDK